MDLEFVAVDPDTRDGNCPTVWVDRDTGELVFQGWDAPGEMIAACLASGTIPKGESVVRLPARMTDAVRRACDVADQYGAGAA
ncbi:hypothetical protein LO772_15145 [Yinghuangia sp. ASG 101]|nr:hypothetical protein [Yinghuangia sp. ASG 101]UGQ14786.1 hypothetical protein LO772_15145 [Yinghuangia sp. ASG 101]